MRATVKESIGLPGQMKVVVDCRFRLITLVKFKEKGIAFASKLTENKSQKFIFPHVNLEPTGEQTCYVAERAETINIQTFSFTYSLFVTTLEKTKTLK